MIGENLEPEKALITETDLLWEHTDRACQLWQEVTNCGPTKLDTRYGRICDEAKVSIRLNF